MGFGRIFLTTRGEISVWKERWAGLNSVSYGSSGMYFRFAGRLMKGRRDETVITLIAVSSSSERQIMRGSVVSRTQKNLVMSTNQSTLDQIARVRYLRDSKVKNSTIR